MGGAIIEGLLGQQYDTSALTLIETDQHRRQIFEKKGLNVAENIGRQVGGSSLILIAVKPGQVCTVLKELSDLVSGKNLILSVAAGVSLSHMEKCVGKGVPCARAMPNIAARVGHGATGLCFNQAVTGAQAGLAVEIMESCGKVAVIDESGMDAVTGLSGSGPAYVCLFIEALADAGVLLGLPRPQAIELAVQTVYGTAEMLRQTSDHPALIRESVTSPGGTTAQGLSRLEEHGLKNAVIEAVKAAKQRAGEMSRLLEQ